jgi:hypothetical protein
MPEINDDVFAYDAGSSMRIQSIRGFGEELQMAIAEVVQRARDGELEDWTERQAELERLGWHVDELVRWCQHFNGKVQQLKGDR